MASRNSFALASILVIPNLREMVIHTSRCIQSGLAYLLTIAFFNAMPGSMAYIPGLFTRHYRLFGERKECRATPSIFIYDDIPSSLFNHLSLFIAFVDWSQARFDEPGINLNTQSGIKDRLTPELKNATLD